MLKELRRGHKLRRRVGDANRHAVDRGVLAVGHREEFANDVAVAGRTGAAVTQEPLPCQLVKSTAKN